MLRVRGALERLQKRYLYICITVVVVKLSLVRWDGMARALDWTLCEGRQDDQIRSAERLARKSSQTDGTRSSAAIKGYVHVMRIRYVPYRTVRRDETRRDDALLQLN